MYRFVTRIARCCRSAGRLTVASLVIGGLVAFFFAAGRKDQGAGAGQGRNQVTTPSPDPLPIVLLHFAHLLLLLAEALLGLPGMLQVVEHHVGQLG